MAKILTQVFGTEEEADKYISYSLGTIKDIVLEKQHDGDEWKVFHVTGDDVDHAFYKKW
jgi:hypothetical protein